MWLSYTSIDLLIGLCMEEEIGRSILASVSTYRIVLNYYYYPTIIVQHNDTNDIPSIFYNVKMSKYTCIHLYVYIYSYIYIVFISLQSLQLFYNFDVAKFSAQL